MGVVRDGVQTVSVDELRHTEGNVILHIVFAIKQDQVRNYFMLLEDIDVHSLFVGQGQRIPQIPQSKCANKYTNRVRVQMMYYPVLLAGQLFEFSWVPCHRDLFVGNRDKGMSVESSVYL